MAEYADRFLHQRPMTADSRHLLLPGWSAERFTMTNEQMRDRYAETLLGLGFDGIDWVAVNGTVVRRVSFTKPCPSGIYAADDQADTLLDKPGDQPS